MKNFQGKNRDADVENEPVDAREEGKGGTNWKIKIYINTLSQFSQFSRSVVEAFSSPTPPSLRGGLSHAQPPYPAG